MSFRKEPEGLDGGRLLGISLVKSPDGYLQISRGTALSEIGSEMSGLTKRGLLSLCCRLLEHTLWQGGCNLIAASRNGWGAVEGRMTLPIWTDASSLAMGVALEVDGIIVEDAAWLRKKIAYQICQTGGCGSLYQPGDRMKDFLRSPLTPAASA